MAERYHRHCDRDRAIQSGQPEWRRAVAILAREINDGCPMSAGERPGEKGNPQNGLVCWSGVCRGAGWCSWRCWRTSFPYPRRRVVALVLVLVGVPGCASSLVNGCAIEQHGQAVSMDCGANTLAPLHGGGAARAGL